MKTVLTIAGFDPSSGAGVTADLMVFAAHGLFGTACITGLTIQSTLGVQSCRPVDAKLMADTLHCLDADLPPSGIKIGMLENDLNVVCACTYIERVNVEYEVRGAVPSVLDPVITSSSGRDLLNAEGLVILRERLLPLVDWITPNLTELAILSGRKVTCREDVPPACHSLQAFVTRNLKSKPLGIFATGGHLEQPDDFLLTPERKELWLTGERVPTRATHGTGCALSSAFLCGLVDGRSSEEAARGAKAYVTGALRTAIPRGAGAGPMNHLWPLK